jgi:uncharacterized membrane protein
MGPSEYKPSAFVFKTVFAFFIVVSAAFALSVSMDYYSREVVQGVSAVYQVTIQNTNSNGAYVTIAATSPLTTSVSSNNFYLAPSASQTVTLVVYTGNAVVGNYLVNLAITAGSDTYSGVLGLSVVTAGIESSSSSLSVSIDHYSQEVSQGTAAAYQITVKNYGSGATVKIAADSKLPVTVSSNNFYLSNLGQKSVTLVVSTANAAAGDYLINLGITAGSNTYSGLIGTRVIEGGVEMLRMDSEYSRIAVLQGSSETLRFVVRNDGIETLHNVFIRSDIPTRLAPAMPSSFDLDAGMNKTIYIPVTVPTDYPAGDMEFTIKAVHGNTEVSSKVSATVLPLSALYGIADMQVKGIESYKEDNRTVGYLITLAVTNKGSQLLDGLDIKVQNLPKDWKLKGEQNILLKAVELKEVQLIVIPTTFEQRNAIIVLTKDNEAIASANITFTGEKIGMSPTGMFLTEGSVTIGLLFLAILVLVLLYLRQKAEHEKKAHSLPGAEKPAADAGKKKGYLQKLIDSALGEEKKEPETSE